MNTITDLNTVDQTTVGLYGKFLVTRADGKDQPGGKHEHDEYFVLNTTTDRHAIPALIAYAESCQHQYPLLAKDLKAIVSNNLKAANDFIEVPAITLPNGTVVPAFMVGRYHASEAMPGMVTINADYKPRVNINYHDARKASAEAGYQLISETQWLAIAYEITKQDDNWTGGKVGEGEIYRGLHKDTAHGAQNGHFTSEELTERRWHVLSNGERIYDFSGNVYSWVFDDVQGDDNGIIAKAFASDSPTVTTAPYKSREYGIGDTSTGSGNWSGLALVRGGCWYSGGRAGVFILYHVWPDYDAGNVGFRCTKSL